MFINHSVIIQIKTHHWSALAAQGLALGPAFQLAALQLAAEPAAGPVPKPEPEPARIKLSKLSIRRI